MQTHIHTHTHWQNKHTNKQILNNLKKIIIKKNLKKQDVTKTKETDENYSRIIYLIARWILYAKQTHVF